MRFAVLLPAVASLLAAFVAPRAHADMIGGNPGPQYNYVCPHADGQTSLECFFDAVQHLYTMCRNVKSIEIIEFGYEKSIEGTNGAKSESCLDKQKQNIARPYQAALKDAKKSKTVMERLHELHELWLSAMAQLTWRAGETDDDYKARVSRPYEQFRERIASIRTSLTADAGPQGAQAATAKAKTKSGNTKQQAKAKTN
jgi:hypothetical protein